MNDSQIKMNSSSPVMGNSSFVFLNSLDESDKMAFYPTTNGSSITPQEGLKIYTKAMQKCLELLGEAQELEEKIRTKKIPQNKISQQKAEFSKCIMKISEIVGEFLKAFAIVHDDDAKVFLELLYKRFEFIQQNLELYNVVLKQQYADDVKLMLNRCIDTFERMQEELVKPAEAPKTKKVELKVVKEESEEKPKEKPDSVQKIDPIEVSV